ncbi:MAG: DUF2155 domain-containing protein [Pararhodobacter sp.]
MSTPLRDASALVALLCALAANPAAAQQMAESDGVYLRGLDKVSGGTTDLAMRVGDTLSYGRMSVTLSACRYPADNPAADAFAFVEITDELRGERLFYGWMIASSPALNALDHPRYDIWVLGCQ